MNLYVLIGKGKRQHVLYTARLDLAPKTPVLLDGTTFCGRTWGQWDNHSEFILKLTRESAPSYPMCQVCERRFVDSRLQEEES